MGALTVRNIKVYMIQNRYFFISSISHVAPLIGVLTDRDLLCAAFLSADFCC